MWTHRAPRFPDHSLDWFPLSVVKSNALGHLPQRLVHFLYVWLSRGGTRVQPHQTFWGRSLTHCLYGQTVHPWLKRPCTRYHMLHLDNVDIVTDAASRGFPVLACLYATRWTLTLCQTLHPRCIARFPSVSMSFDLACRLGTCWSCKSDGCSISHPRRH